MADLSHLIRVTALPPTVFPLVGTAAGLARWWAEDVESSASEHVRLGFFGRSTVYALRLVEAEESRAATWSCESGREWSGTRLVFELELSGDETVVRFTHAAWSEATDYFHSCNTVWGELMFRLKAEAEGRRPGPLFGRDALSY